MVVIAAGCLGVYAEDGFHCKCGDVIKYCCDSVEVMDLVLGCSITKM